MKTENLIKALLNPGLYPDRPEEIKSIQTQMSVIFLTGKYAYKIKKPVNLGFLDYTTLNNRKHFCDRELELNRILSPEIYLEVIPITETKRQITLGLDGEIIDYVLKMKQLPADRMLDYLLKQKDVSEQMITAVANRMAQFHDKATSGPQISSFGTTNAISINIEENRAQTEKYVNISISDYEFERINSFNHKFFSDNKALFAKRMAEGRIKDCHGDLHAAHICFYKGIQIYDCIEFNDRFRYCDVASEIAFLAMDLERYQRTDLSNVLVNSYIDISGDAEIRNMINFYKCYRAYVRGKVESFKYDDRLIEDKESSLRAARDYFHLAYRYTREKPVLVILCGLMGTGKSTLAQALRDKTGFPVISSDITRKQILGVPSQEHRFEKFDTGIYSVESTIATYDSMFNKAKQHLSAGQSVILDASFKKKEYRKHAIEIAQEHHADFLLIECMLDESKVKSRLDKRMNEISFSDGRWEIFATQKQDFDKITEFSPDAHIIIDTSAPTSKLVSKILERRL